jgi:hypothetical protein
MSSPATNRKPVIVSCNIERGLIENIKRLLAGFL